MSDWTALAAEFGSELSAALRTDAGAAAGAALRGVQAAALIELGRHGGTFLQGRIGCGKSLFAMLAPAMARAERPVILMPGGMIRPFRSMLEDLRHYWRIALGIVLLSYQEISRMPAAGRSIVAACGSVPDLLVCDEAHALANVGPGGSGVANQVHDLLREHPEIQVAICTGTADRTGIRDYAHLIEWALRDRNPLPSDPTELKLWSQIIDEGDESEAAYLARKFGCAPTIREIRRAYRALLRAAPGVIIKDDPFTGVPLTIRCVEPKTLGSGDRSLEPHLRKLRELHQWPDGVEPGAPDESRDPDRVEGPIWTTARRMARGLCHVYNPPPPQEWREARRAYGSAVRAAIASGRAYTALEAERKAEPGGELLSALERWRAVAEAVGPLNQETLWLSEATIAWVERWGRERPGLIFVDDIEFGRYLSLRTDWVFYGEAGEDSRGRAIEEHPKQTTAIATRGANGTGRNLQKIWNRMLIVTCGSTAAALEQNVGRLHREEETLPVQADILCICPEDTQAIERILTGIPRTQDSFCELGIAAANWS